MSRFLTIEDPETHALIEGLLEDELGSPSMPGERLVFAVQALSLARSHAAIRGVGCVPLLVEFGVVPEPTG